jgi:hypothetical protein
MQNVKYQSLGFQTTMGEEVAAMDDSFSVVLRNNMSRYETAGCANGGKATWSYT